jgi:hypothetical protein
MSADTVAARPFAAWRALATSGALGRRASKTAASNGSLDWRASVRKQGRCLMHLAEKLRFLWTASHR